MNRQSRITRSLGHLFFWAGIVLGIALLAGSVWADIEARFYGFMSMGDRPVRTLSCPLLITPSGTAKITARFTNPTDRDMNQLLRTDISGPLVQTDRKSVTLAPGESRRVSWDVTWNDVAFGMFVLIQVAAFPAHPFSFRQSSCGMVAVDVPFLSGGQLTALILVLTLLSAFAGLYLLPDRDLTLGKRVLHASYGRVALAGIVLAGLLFSLINATLVAGLLLLLAVLTAVSMLYLIVM